MKFLYGMAVCIITIIFIWVWPPGSMLAPDCQLDGSFNDWKGRAGLTDPEGDGGARNDLCRISWSTNDNEEKLYFMIERYAPYPKDSPMECVLYFDLNANGSYEDLADRYAEINFQPQNDKGRVVVTLYSVNGETREEYSGLWGEGIEKGARRMEFAVPMEDLDMYPAQYIRFFLSDSRRGFDRLPDRGDNQWRPFPVVFQGKSVVVLICLVWLVITMFLYYNKIWVLYYIWGAVGLCCVLILLFRGSYGEYFLARQTSMVLHYLLAYFDIITYVFDRAPGTLLVLIKVDNSWTTIAIDIENSGLLEVCIFFGLIMFYPVHRLGKRIGVAAVGVTGIYTANILRLFLVILLIHRFGRDMSYITHTLIGRLLFFLLIVAVYWWFITRPSLENIREKVKDA